MKEVCIKQNRKQGEVMELDFQQLKANSEQSVPIEYLQFKYANSMFRPWSLLC